MNSTANLSRTFVPCKSLDNPQPRKPSCASDRALAEELEAILAAVPVELQPAADKRFPLLSGLRRQDLAGVATARRIVFISARIHHWSDERRTAEYLLRHRDELADGRRTALALVAAARCAAEMDARRARVREIPLEPEVFSRRGFEPSRARTEDASVADTVIDYLRSVAGGCAAGAVAWDRLHDAVAVAVELASQLKDHGALSIRAMRSDARAGARLSCRLVEEFGDRNVARSLARLLVGGDGTPVESALLWWVAHRDTDPADIPDGVRAHWVRDLMDADPALSTSRTRRRRDSSGHSGRASAKPSHRTSGDSQCVRIRPGVS